MSTPRQFIRRPRRDDEPQPIEAIRFDGTAECAETIRAWLERRYRAVSPYSSVPPPAVEYVQRPVDGTAWLIFKQGNSKHAAAVAGQWLVAEGRAFHPWLQDDYEFEEYYVERAEENS